ncbi:neurofilament light polypeptide [Salix suchowensis]|nr:neurofilament light polypeptide [Salix suchowensis]
MKTVTGKITKSTPVTIAKAASILSKFVSTDTGASQALNAYLRRATAAFDELARLHSKSDRRKHKRDSAPDQRVERRLKMEVKEEGNAAEEETGRRRKAKKKRKGDLEEETERSNEVKKEKIEVEVNEGKVVGKVENKVEKKLKKKKRKRNSGEVEPGLVGSASAAESPFWVNSPNLAMHFLCPSALYTLSLFDLYLVAETNVEKKTEVQCFLKKNAKPCPTSFQWFCASIRGAESEHAAEQDCSNGIGLALWGKIRF